VEIDATAMRAAWSILEALLRGRTPGETVASRAAAPFLERRFDLALVGAISDGQESAYRLTGQERRGLGLWGTMTRFVGRRDEIEVLQRRLALAESGHGQVAAVVGEAGVGKSRLIHEFAHAQRPEGWRILEGMSVSYGQAMSYLPVVDLLRQYFSIQDRDDLRAVREKIMGKLLALDPALQPTLPAFQALLDVPFDDAAWQVLDPTQRRQRTLDAVKRLLLREASEQPLLLIFEDLHWSDSETQALLETLVDGLGAARLLLLVSYRPVYRHPWGATTYFTLLQLENLPADGTGELLEALLGEDPGLAPLKDVLVGRGNPFFLEETVRTLVETNALEGDRGRYRLVQPVDTLEVPPTVQTLLAARIDRLPPEAKRLLQVTSVIGKDVPFALLRTIAGLPEEALRRELEDLQSAEFLYEKRLDEDLEYAFKHALTHEVTYSGLPPARRRELHAQIVSAIEMLHRDRLGEQIERLAHHALRGELREKAVAYLRQAGNKAARHSALAGARAWFEQALAILERLPEDRSTLEHAFEIRLELRPVLHQLGDIRQTLERLREAEALAGRLNDEHRRGRVCAFMTNAHVLLNDLDEALVTGSRALEIAGRLGDLRLRILTTAYLELAHHSRGEYGRVVELATENLATLPADWAYEYPGATAPRSVLDRHFLVMALAPLGRFAEAADYEAEGLRLAESTHHPFSVGMACFAAGMFHLLRGNWVRARSLIEQEIAATRTGNVVLLLPWAIASSAWILAQLGEPSEALTQMEEGEQLLERQAASGILAHQCWGYHSLGRASLLVGHLDAAQRHGNHAVECSARQPGFAAYALHLLGDIASHLDRFDAAEAEACYRNALALAEPRGMRPLVAHCHLGLGKLYRRTGKRQQAQEHLVTAATMYREMDMRFWLEQAEVETRTSEELARPTAR
jgi:tetratricopeptide (TPR) repeat protein